MSKSLTEIQNLFESVKKADENGQEYWLARELMPLLEYERWESFDQLVQRAMVSLTRTYPQTGDHFRQTTKKIKIAAGSGKEAIREIKDYKLTRYACYLIAHNGNPQSPKLLIRSVSINTEVINGLRNYIVLGKK